MLLLFIILFIIQTLSTEPSRFDSLIIYQINVATYNNGGNGNGYTKGWGTKGQNFSGDLLGIIKQLDHIAEMGFNAIWLTPIFDSGYTEEQDFIGNCSKHSSTGYFGVDYFNVDPHFGTNEQFEQLVKKAHRLNIYVILDGVFGHTKGSMCGVSIKESPSGKLPICLTEGCGINTEYNVLDYRRKETIEFFQEVTKYWIEKYKIDGWRLDVANELTTTPSSDLKKASEGNVAREIVKAVKEATQKNKQNGEIWGILGYIVGEIWDGWDMRLKDWYGSHEGDSLPSYFDFPTYYHLIKSFTQEWNGNKNNDFFGLHLAQTQFDNSYPSWAHPNCFIGNHDLHRVGNLIRKRWNVGPKSKRYWDIHFAMQTYQFLHRGPITIYYGEEIGEIVDCYHKTEDCMGRDDNSARSNPTPEHLLSQFQRENREKMERLLHWRKIHPLSYCKQCKSSFDIDGHSVIYKRFNMNSSTDAIDQFIYIANFNENVPKKVNFNIKGYLYDVITGDQIKGDEEFIIQPFTSYLLEVYRIPGSQIIEKTCSMAIKQFVGNRIVSKSCLILSNHL